MRSLNHPASRRPQPARFKNTSGRGTHNAGSTFVNARIIDVDVDTVNITYTFDQNVSLSGIPNINTELDLAIIAATLVASNQVMIEYAASQAAATEFTVPMNDPAIRTRSGGWVAAGTFPVPT